MEKEKKWKKENQNSFIKENFIGPFILAILLFVLLCIIIPQIGIPFLFGGMIMAVFLFGVALLCRIFNHSPQKNDWLIPQESLENIKIPTNMPLPCVIIGREKKILRYNEDFKQVFHGGRFFGRQITEVFPEYKFHINKQRLSFDEKFYDVYTKKCDVIDTKKEDNNDVCSVCFVDITENQMLQNEILLQKTVVALVFIDNYEEVIESLDENSLPLLTALIDRKLNSLASGAEGIMKKFEKDRYVFLLSQQKLEEIKERKFEILNEIREINIGEHIPVTLSIGIGIGQKSLDEAMKNARAAIDLALGRGGDQALIKEGEKYLFYGGKSGEVSHNARIRARVKADALWELMGEASDVIVMGHRQADLDSLGSAIGIYAIAKTMKKPCHILMDSVSSGVRRLVERLKEQGGYENLFCTGAEAIERMTDRTLLIITDTHRHGLVECENLLNAAKKIVVFDHHRKSTDFIERAVLIYHEPYASSTAELVTEMIQYIGEKVKLKPIEADALLAGITVDTKSFCVKTGAITFEAAAYLKRNGADSIRVRLLFQNDMEEYKAKAAAVKEAEIYMGDIAVSVCPPHIQNTTLTAAQAADDLLNVTGIRASFVLCNIGDTVFVSARSFGDINVQMIMEKVGGGGHLSVSGAQFKDISLYDAKEKVKSAIKEYMENE